MNTLTAKCSDILDRIVEKTGLSGKALKIIASIIMVIDHSAIAVLNPYIDYNVGNMSYETFKSMTALYNYMRAAGRIAFPIYCFLLVEGFLHTSNFLRYARNLLIGGLVSEVLFDLALFNRLTFSHQNVYFTLLIGLCCIHLIRELSERRNPMFSKLNPILIYIGCLIAIGGSMTIAYYLKTDYSYKGVLAITLMYLFRKNRLFKCVLGEIPFNYEPTAFISIIPLLLYNKKRGSYRWKYTKYAFYAFYPAHLLILYIISWLMGCR